MEDIECSGCLLFEHIEVGMKVIDANDTIGVVKECFDIHNVLVDYLNGGSGLYCLDSECESYDPLYLFEV